MKSGQKIGGRYEVRRKLGHGGMAEIYLVHDSSLDRDVALKFLPGDLKGQTGLRLRFEREVHTIASLEHSAIVPVYDVGDHEGQPYLVMRYMPGGSLTQRLGRLTLAETAVIFRRLASGLDKAHEKGFIHRDIKPDNILFDEDGLAYLADFGISRPTEEPSLLTQSGNAIGTPYYMSPEQIRGEKLNGRSDIYSLGVMLFEMWAGQRPYQATTMYDLMTMHVQAPIPDILRRNPQLPPACQTVVNRAMAKKPQERYATGREMAEAITAVSRPTVAAPKQPVMETAVFLQNEKTVVEPPVTKPKPQLPQPAPKKRISPLWWLAGIGLISYTVWQLAFAGNSLANLPALSLTATNKIATPTLEPPTPESGIELGATRARPADGMVMVGVPGGTFMMGSDPEQDANAQDDEQPQHPVTLDAYWIDQTEVTNTMYTQCVTDRECKASATTNDGNYNGSNYPVVGVSWLNAHTYCRWAGGRLPTEAEWEYAARGGTSRIYPWDGGFDPSYLNSSGTGDGHSRTAPVGSFSPAGDSWVGAQDMAGNIWEWVYDWYDANLGDSLLSNNPIGPKSGNDKVLRGGSWGARAFDTRAANRHYADPSSRVVGIGFRCVVPADQ